MVVVFDVMECTVYIEEVNQIQLFKWETILDLVS